MSSLHLVSRSLLLTSLVLVSCVDDRTPVARSVAPLLASTYTFVLTDLAIDQHDDTRRAGFNFDGMYSTATQASGCNVADFHSTVTPNFHEYACDPSDPNCLGGVDNRLPELVQLFDHTARTSLREAVHTSLQQGRAIWLLRVSDVDSLDQDDFVRINLYRGFALSSSCATAFGGAGQFKVDDASLSVTGDIDQPLWWLSGWIDAGNLHVARTFSMERAVQSPVPMQVALGPSSSFTTNLYQPTLYFSAAKLTSGTAFTANFGGWFNTDNLSYMLELANSDISGQIFQFMPQLSDLPNPTTHACDTGTPLAVGGLSFGATVTLQVADIVGTSSSAGSGTCGTVW